MTSLLKEKARLIIPIVKVRRKGRLISQPMITPEILLNTICDVMSGDKEKVCSKCRKKEIVKVRAVFYYLGSGYKFKLETMSGLLGQVHSTAIHHNRVYHDQLNETKPWFNPQLAAEIEDIRHRIKVRLIYCQ